MLGAFNRSYAATVAVSALCVGLAWPVSAEPVSRSGQIAGAVIARKTGEEVRFIDISNWQVVDLRQDLKTGDVLRTNDTGQLAILFSDRTQVRLARNSSLVVKQITAGTSADTILQLQSGTIWARAERGGPGVQVETPAAAAAIRGTDWTMTVNGSQTSLTVLEGLVQFSNPQGSLEIKQGEGAVASIGQAPRRLVVVNSNDREQMLFFMPAREAFERMEPAGQPAATMRADINRILAVPPSRRSTEDWVSLAEMQLTIDGRNASKDALAVLKDKRLSGAQSARVTLIEAILAAGETRYAEAAKLFAKAGPGLDLRRRGIALYGGYYARGLADPNRVEALPNKVTSAKDAFLRAYALAVTKDIKSGIEALAEAEKRFPKDPELPAYRAWMAMLINDREQAKEAMEKAIAADPQEPVALEARSIYKADVESDLMGALADAEASIGIAPGVSSGWNQIGNIQSERGAELEAEAAYKKAIELKPEDPLAHANLAGFYLTLSRMQDAKKHIDRALELDPTLSFSLLARGRYYLQTGEVDKALDDMLAGTVADPGVAFGQILLTAAHIQKGDRLAAGQAIDNADRLNRNDPVVPALRTIIALDDYDSVGAIRNAQEYVRRGRARGGDYGSLGANQDAGSILNYAFRFQGLNSWAEYYSDAVFDPFSGASYIDQMLHGSANPFANSFLSGTDIISNSGNDQGFSSLLQGLLLEPHLIASKSIGNDIFSQPFLETTIGGGVNMAGGRTGYVTEANVQGYSNLPFPISFNGTLQWQRVPDSRDFSFLSDMNTENRIVGGSAYLSASPTISDRVVMYFTDTEDRFHQRNSFAVVFGGLIFPVDNIVDTNVRAMNAGIGWSHTFEYQNVMNAALLYSGSKSKTRNALDILGLPLSDVHNEVRQDTYVAALSHTIGADNFTWRYGIEGGWADSFQSTVDLLGFPVIPFTQSDKTAIGRVYVDLLHEITPDLKAEYALFGTYVESNDNRLHFDPRIGIAWSPMEGQWLRAGFMRNSLDFSTPTLSPIGIVGLQQNQISVDPGGRVDTYALRWDAEWTRDFFTAVEFQHQDIRDPSISVPLQSINLAIDKARIDRGSVTANLLLGHGFGLSSTVAYTDSYATSPGVNGTIPYLPKWAGQVALTWVSEANLRTTLAANYIGERQDTTATRLGSYWSLDAGLTWEPFDSRIELELAAFNLLDEEFLIDRDALGNPVPGWGRSFKGTLKVRF